MKNYLEGFLQPEEIHYNNQSYSFARLVEKPELTKACIDHAKNEARLLDEFKPDCIFADSGFITDAIVPEIPVYKILDRFFLEIAMDVDSPFDSQEKAKIREDIEKVVNSARKELDIIENFTYLDHISNRSLLNGASYFIEDVKLPNHILIGINMFLKGYEISRPEYRNCFIILGTGLNASQARTASEILMRAEPHFKKIYVTYGNAIQKDQLYQPKNAIMNRLYKEIPEDIGILICHGGYGTVHLGIQLGIPMIVVPFHIEQYSNAYRMEKLGAGLNIGTYDNSGFKGIYQKFTIDWDQFEWALENSRSLRKRRSFYDEYKSYRITYFSEIDKLISTF
ncbi:MAG: glycosyltransferase [bacterium]